jgi:hypothetical protein
MRNVIPVVRLDLQHIWIYNEQKRNSVTYAKSQVMDLYAC